MRRSPRRTTASLLASGLLLVPLALAPAAAGVLEPFGCTVEDPQVVRVEVLAELDGDGTVTDARREEHRSSDGGRSCHDAEEQDATALPVAVAVLHSDPAEGALETGQLGQVDGPITTRVAVRDRTAEPRTVTVAAPGGPDRREQRVGVPHLVRLSVRYPSTWSTVAPGIADVRTDVVDGGVRVDASALLFPPVTGDEVVLPVTAEPGRGVPTVAVELVPIADAETARLAADELGRDATAVVAALAETGADGADQLADGVAELADGLDELAGGAARLADGLSEAEARGAELRRGARQLADGMAELSAGMRQLSAGLQPLAAGARQVAEGNRQMADRLSTAADGADALADANEDLAEGADQLAAGTRELSAAARTLRDAIAHLPDLGPVTDAVIAPADELLAGAERATSSGERLAEGNREVARGNRELAAGLREAAGGSRELAEGSEQVADGAEEAADGSRRLAEGSEELADGAEQLSAGVDAYTRGVEEAAGASRQLADGAGEAAEAADALADGAAQLPAALRQARDTADREHARQAEERAVVALGRRLAERMVHDATGDAPSRTLTTELVAAGSEPARPAVLLALVVLVLASGATAAAWRRERAGEAV